MDAALKAKWVEALRSGDFKQGREYLHKGDTYCCLGVLCELSGEGAWTPPDPDGSCRYLIDGSGLRATLPSAIADKYAVGNHAPLITMNDTGHSFPEIADYIEKNL